MEKYLSFQGRATRSEYWGTMLITFVSGFLTLVLIGVMMDFIDTDLMDLIGSIAIILLGGLIVWVQAATVTRRCRDITINPWFTLTIFIPYLGFIPWVIFGCLNTVNNEE